MLNKLLRTIGLMTVLVASCATVAAQSRNDDWEIGKVYVPEDNPEIFNAFIPRDFWPIELKELNEKLELHRQQMLKQELNPVVLDKAVYVATVNRELILSDNSYWKFSGFPSNGLVRVGRVSFALRDAKGNRAEQPQLSAVNRFDTEGLIEVESSGLENPLWFGFQLAPEVEDNRRLFYFEIPRAKLGSMLISADSNLVLSSEQVVVEPVANPMEVLGNQWPQALEPRLQPRQTWWHVHLSGVTKFSLAISESVIDRGQSFHHAIASCAINHLIGPDSITSNASFQLASESSGLPVQLKLDPSQRVRSLTVDGKVAAWKAVIAEEKSHVIQLSSVNISKGSRIEVQTVAKRESLQSGAAKGMEGKSTQVPRQQTIALPGIEIANSFVLSGATNVSCDSSIELIQVMPESSQRAAGGANIQFSTIGEKWSSQWSRQPSRDQAVVVDREERWTANSLCRLSLQTSTISATVNSVLTGSNLRSNEVRIPILKGWSVDRIRFPFDVAGKIRSGIVSSQAGDEIVLGWQGRPDNFEVYMEVTASNYLPGQSETLSIENPRVFSLPQESSPMYYLIEDSSKYKLRGSPSLLSMSVSKRDLSSWQQQLLGENDTTLYRDLSSSQGKFVFDAFGDRASLSLASILETTSNGNFRLNTILNIAPANGNLDRIQLSLPNLEKLSDWTFEYSSSSDAGIPLQPKVIRQEPNTDMIVELSLPIAAINPFHVVASRTLAATANRSEPIGIPLIAANDFVLADSVLLLPSAMANFSDTEELELLPSVGCCNAETMDLINKIRDKRSALMIDSWVTARLEGNQSRYLKLLATGADRTDNWIWNQTLRHQVTSSGEIRHTLAIDLQISGDQSLKIGIPSDWSLLSANVNDLPSKQYSFDKGVLEFLNLGSQRVRIEAVFESPIAVLNWHSRFELQRPEYDVPVLQSSETVSIPPAYAFISEAMYSGSLLSNSIGFWPANWWSVLSPNSSSTSANRRIHWTEVDVAVGSEGEPSQFHIIHRSALASLGVVVLLALSVVAWVLLHYWIRGWWWGSILAGCGVTLLSGPFAAIAQIVLLAFMLGAFTRLVAYVARKPKTLPKRSPLSGARATLTALFLACCISQSSHAQTSDADLKQTEANEKRVFGVIIPFNGSVESPGEYAYIPKELRDLLPGSTTAPTPRQISPKIVSASYVMKLRQDPRDTSPVHEFNVELKLQIYDANSSLLLPFNLEVLRPTSLVLNGQPRLLGVRYFEEAEDRSGIIFRPDSTGTVSISMQFQPTLTDSPDRKYTFSTPLPAVPNAVLRIVPNSLTSGLVTNASGGFQRTLSGDISANLGPISELEVEWSESDRVAQAIAAEYGSETWVRDFGDGLCVASQIILDRGRSTQDEFDLFVDSDWEPVGSKWGNADLVSSTVVPALKRRVIRIRLDESAGSLTTIRMLLAQRSQIRSTNLEVPFLMIDRLALKGKYFWWSSDKDADWIPEGLESLPVRTSRDDWGDLKLATDRSGYQIIGSNIKLRQQSNSQLSNTQVEASTLRVYSSHTELELEASWERMSLQSDDIAVSLPSFSTLRKVEINGKSITPSQSNSNRLTIPSNLTNQLANRIRISVELPPMHQVVDGLPRILIENSQPRQSSYVVFRGADLQLRFLPTDSGLVFTSAPTVSRRANMESMEVFVGEANLPTEMLGDRRLSVQLEVQPVVTSEQSAFTMQLSRIATGWRATVRCVWNDSTQIDYAIFEVPATLRDLIDAAPLSSIFKPHRDNSRTTLCIPIPTQTNQSNSKIVEFSFPIASLSSTQSFALPNIVAHHGHGQPTTPVVILPKKVDGRAVDWITTGTVVNSKWFELSVLQPQEDLQYLSFGAAQNKLSWQFSESQRQQARVDLVWMDLTSSTRSKVAAIMNYWITPRSQVTQVFEIPTNCEVLGVECGTRRTNWSIEGNKLRVTLQPNSVPIVVRVMSQWKLESSDRSLINFPKPLNAELPARFFLSKSSSGVWSPTDASMDSDAQQQAIVDQWASIVAQTMDSLSSMSKASASNWLNSWHPESLAIKLDKQVGPSIASSLLSTVDINDDSQISVAELWQRAEELGQSEALDEVGAIAQTGLQNIAQVKWSIAGDALEIVRADTTIQHSSPKYFAAISIIAVGVLGGFAAPRLKNLILSLLAAQPWIYWLLLALILAWILPVTWPAIFVAFVALWMAVSQFIENHRRTRRFGF